MLPPTTSVRSASTARPCVRPVAADRPQYRGDLDQHRTKLPGLLADRNQALRGRRQQPHSVKGPMRWRAFGNRSIACCKGHSGAGWSPARVRYASQTSAGPLRQQGARAHEQNPPASRVWISPPTTGERNFDRSRPSMSRRSAFPCSRATCRRLPTAGQQDGDNAQPIFLQAANVLRMPGSGRPASVKIGRCWASSTNMMTRHRDQRHHDKDDGIHQRRQHLAADFEPPSASKSAICLRTCPVTPPASPAARMAR